jgi:sec-independent protein translocase protein TatC
MTTTPSEEDEIESSRMPLMEHLVELRKRLMWSGLSVFIFFIIGYFIAPYIFQALMWPQVLAYGGNLEGRRMIFTAPQEAFFTNVKIAFWAAVFVSFPVIATQLWKFVAPGLYKNEKRAFLPFLVATPFMFFLGGALVYFFIMPMALKFFLTFEQMGGESALAIVNENKVNEYLSFVMTLIFAFGIAFQLPVLLTLLVRVGILSVAQLVKGRRYAIVIIFIFAAIVTPPDPLSQVALAVPLLGLYEAAIFFGRLIEKKRAAEEAAQTAEEAKADDQPSA